MSASNSLTRGPLPPGVYWRRRIVVLVGAAVLVFLIAQLLGGGSDGKSGGDPSAQQAGAAITTSASETSSATSPSSSAPTSTGTATTTAPSSVSTSPLTLAAPSGNCDPRDITVTPQVQKATAGSDVTIDLALQTKTTAACTWQLTQHNLAMKIVRYGKVLWTSQQCWSALPQRSVVVRNVVPTLVSMVWNARVSTEGCRRGAPWVRPGTLVAWTSTLGGEPGHASFDLVLPSASTVMVTPTSSAATSTAPSKSGTAEPRR